MRRIAPQKRFNHLAPFATAGFALVLLLLWLGRDSQDHHGRTAQAGSLMRTVLPPVLQRARNDQEDFCPTVAPELRDTARAAEGYLKAEVPAGVGRAGLMMTMWVHDSSKGSDYVSADIAKFGVWERGETEQLLDKLEQFRLEHRLPREDVVFIDIGANVGWYTLNAAAMGYTVLAVEPLASNLGAIRRSLCASPIIQQRVHLLNTGLSDKSRVCKFYSLQVNKGNGVTVCDKHNQEKMPEGMVLRGKFHLATLDDMFKGEAMAQLAGRVAMIKIDAEGHEPLVFAGAKQFMATVKPKYIFSEVNGPALQATGFKPEDMFQLFDRMGYELHLTSFDSAAENPENFATLAERSHAAHRDVNFYLTLRQGTQA